MGQVLLVVLAAIMIYVGVVAYNQSAGERRVAEARAYAIEQQASADAAATRWMAMYPGLMVIGGTIVGVIWGIGFVLRAKNSKPQVVEHRVMMLPAPQQHPAFLGAPNYIALQPGLTYEELPAPSYKVLAARNE